MKYPPCKRCGICCKSGACRTEFDRMNGFCPHLKQLDSGIYECAALTSGLLKPQDIGIGTGCVIQAVPEAYEFYLQKFNPPQDGQIHQSH